ncbi:Aldose reductase [Clonorchis sinensis]|uniref:Aldose reductase n=1 Tax=Clonorchis sinensis TaxID=79923 RepID=A0A8T1M9G9_CLOSI|nr:Aldose reductase [Clonorchis sinensis]
MLTPPLSELHDIPILGLGTWRVSIISSVQQLQSSRTAVGEAISVALATGYRHIDCAYLYGNEKEIGNALRSSMEHLGLKRDEMFIVSKLWCTHFRPELVQKCCEQSLSDLGLHYIDLYLMHSPMAFQPGASLFPVGPDGVTIAIDKVPLNDTWKAMENLVDVGLVKSIGLSNFNKHQIVRILTECRIKPINLQIEAHVNFPNSELVSYAQSLGITVTAYAPLGSPGGFRGKTNLLNEKWISDIAVRKGKTNAQVLLRYLIQRGLIVIPKSVKPERIKENAQVFDFELTPKEMNLLNTMGLNERQFRFKNQMHHPEYPFRADQ